MKTKLIVLTALLLTSLCLSAITTNSPTDVYPAASYDNTIVRWGTVQNLQDAAGKVLVLPLPDATAYSESYASVWIGNTQFVTTTSVYSSAYAPISWNTALWPYADTNGIRYDICIITNSPSYTFDDITVTGAVSGYLQVFTTGALSSVEIWVTNTVAPVAGIAITNNTITVPISNFWINTTGTAAGWELIN